RPPRSRLSARRPPRTTGDPSLARRPAEGPPALRGAGCSWGWCIAVPHRRERHDPEVAAGLDAAEPLPDPVSIRLTSGRTGRGIPLDGAPAPEVPRRPLHGRVVVAEHEPDVPAPRRPPPPDHER